MDIAHVGILSITTVEGRNLKSMELMGEQDPYCKFELGKYTKRGKTVNRGGRNPYFGEEELIFWISEQNWVDPMKLLCFDEDIGSDDLIGDAEFSILKLMQDPTSTLEQVVPLVKNHKDAGEVFLKFQFFPAGKISINCVAGRKLRDVDTLGRQDPYLKFILEGSATKMTKKTLVDKDGGTDPIWNDAVTFDAVDQFNIAVEVWDQDKVGSDDLIGSTSLPLLPLYRHGYLNEWYPIYYKGKWGGKDPAGEIHLEILFEGPKGVAFPQHQVCCLSVLDDHSID